MDVALSRPVPAEVAAVLGDNRLAASAPSPEPSAAPAPVEVAAHASRAVRHQPAVAAQSGRRTSRRLPFTRPRTVEVVPRARRRR